MSPSLSSIAPEYVVESFLVATRNPLFHGCWITAETWCNLIKKIYINNTSLEFNGQILIKALGLKRYQDLRMQMEAEKAMLHVIRQAYSRENIDQKTSQCVIVFMPPLRGKSQKQMEVSGVIILVT
jgi:hypothetical protein